MLFKRRDKEDRWTRLRVYFLPRRNYARSFRYVGKRVLRLRGTPHAIATGFSAGSFASFTPFMGFHFILSFAIAWLFRGSMIAAAFGTAVGNPLTFPFIWAATLSIGRIILGSDRGESDAAGFGELLAEQGFVALWEPFILPMLVGGVPLGLLSVAVFYPLTRITVAAFQTRKAARLAAGAWKRQQRDAEASDTASASLETQA